VFKKLHNVQENGKDYEGGNYEGGINLKDK